MAAPRLPIPAAQQPANVTPISGNMLDRPGRTGPEHDRRLSQEQLAAIRAVMRIFIEDDLAGGMPESRRMYCDACQQEQPAPGFIRYDQHSVCNACAMDYEVARAEGRVASATEFVRARTVACGKRRSVLSRLK